MSHSPVPKSFDSQSTPGINNPGVCIRRARIDDAEALSVFATAVFPLGCPANTDPADLAYHSSRELTAERFRTLIENSKAILLVAEVQGQICGCVLALRSSPHPQIEDVAAAELQKFYVAPAHHGRGVAHKLMSHVLTSLDHEHLAAVWLSVNSENPRAIAFYKKCSFYIVGTHEVLVGADRQKDFVMRRDLLPVPQERSREK